MKALFTWERSPDRERHWHLPGATPTCRDSAGNEGLRKGNVSEFVADAVRWRLFDLNASAARAKNTDEPSEEIDDAIEAALAEVRAERFRKPA